MSQSWRRTDFANRLCLFLMFWNGRGIYIQKFSPCPRRLAVPGGIGVFSHRLWNAVCVARANNACGVKIPWFGGTRLINVVSLGNPRKKH